eukprot:TRINITY_DN79762_c0_g1_i1.p2 TRINITY_DN79762_c0_g1~~TRINITY_DN79762_c0_g1_i1.p2  ORF type:complete len:121 (-),score=23.57 TRINITY_DN79762_c0_g1_i1:58-420(-)
MPCYKDLALSSLDSGVVRGSVLIRNNRGARSSPDLRTWQPSHVVETAQLAELRHAEVLRNAAQRHLLRTTKQQVPKLMCEAGLEESAWLRRISPDYPPPSKASLGRSRGGCGRDATAEIP